MDATEFNALFSARVDSADGREKLAEAGGSYIRDRLREVSYARSIIPPEQVTRQDCQISTQHDTLIKIVFVEPKSRAMSITFRGEPTVNFIRAPRAEVAFFTIASEIFQKSEQELLAYGDMPITKVIEDNSVKDMQEIEDREFTFHIEAAVQALQAEANGLPAAPALNAAALGGGSPPVEFSVFKGELARSVTGAAAATATVYPVQRPDFVTLRKSLNSNRLRAQKVLMTEPDHDDIMSWTMEDQGSQIQGETLVEGFKYSTVLGLAIVKTIKTDILRRGNMYVFTDPKFFGKFYVLNQTKFYIDKKFNQISWQAWEDIAMSVINVAAVRKLELYPSDATVNDTDGILSSVIPVGETDLGALNNRVDQGVRFPAVSQYLSAG